MHWCLGFGAEILAIRDVGSSGFWMSETCMSFQGYLNVGCIGSCFQSFLVSWVPGGLVLGDWCLVHVICGFDPTRSACDVVGKVV